MQKNYYGKIFSSFSRWWKSFFGEKKTFNCQLYQKYLIFRIFHIIIIFLPYFNSKSFSLLLKIWEKRRRKWKKFFLWNNGWLSSLFKNALIRPDHVKVIKISRENQVEKSPLFYDFFSLELVLLLSGCWMAVFWVVYWREVCLLLFDGIWRGVGVFDWWN